MKMKNLRSLLFVILSFVLSIRTEIEVLAQDDADVPLTDNSLVWINANGYGVSYSNVAYQVNAINPDTYQLFCYDASPIDLQDIGTYTIYAGYPYGERSKIIDISDQTEANLNDLDCWYATGQVSTFNPSTELVFRSQLAKISIEVDMSAYTGDIYDFSAKAIEAATEYTCGSDHPQEIKPSQTTDTINLKVEKIEDKKWKIEGLLIPSNPGSLKILYVDEDGTHEFSDLFVDQQLSAGKVYSAKLTYDNKTQTFDIINQQSANRSTFTAEFTVGSNFLARYDVLPQTISGTPIEMEQSASSGSSIEKALKGTVTVPYETNQVSISDIVFSTSFPDHETITFDNGNPTSINGINLYGSIRLSSESQWSSGSIPLEEGITQTVLLALEYSDYSVRYYSIDITRSPKPVSTISISSAQLNFGELEQGYQNVTSESVTIENTGNTSIVLEQPTSSTSFDVGTLGSFQLDPGNTTTFTIAPRIGLTPGTYDETITIKGTNGIETTISVSVVVKPTQQEESIHHSTHSSCDVYDKNCDGVITCQERYGFGWIWSESDQACIMTSSISPDITARNDGYSFVNTADK